MREKQTILRLFFKLSSLFLLQVFVGAKEEINGLENSPLTEAWAVLGGHVLLPCNMDPPVANDSTHLVLFYYGDAGTPIYSLDARGSRLDKATHWADISFVSRAFISTDLGQRGLLLEKVSMKDQGHYRCRVDFLESPTRNSRIKLTVVVPPTRIQIMSNLDPGQDLQGTVGPYTLGTEVIYTCRVTGGSPRPTVSWWDGDILLDNISEVNKGQVTSNEMYQPSLTRYDFNRTLTCIASNSDLVKPLMSSITIDMTYSPTEVLLEQGSPEISMKQGMSRRISCEVRGSRPPAKIIWKMGERRLYKTGWDIQEEVLRGGATRSVFAYFPDLRDNGQILECSAYNPAIPQVVLRNTTKMAILYKPRMELQPESEQQLQDLREGSDVTLRCLVDANPAVTGVQWSHNGVPIQGGSGYSVKVTQGTLSLRSISRFTSGNYTCAAANTEGANTSNVLTLDVKYPPVCAPGQQKVFGAARNEELFVPCQVSSYPQATSFRWAVNTSSDIVDIPLVHSTRTGSVSTLRYTPQTGLDFGDLLCWGANEVGTQRTPCVFQVIPAAKPEAVSDCIADRNASMPFNYVVVVCTEGWGGGLNQSFTLEVRQQATEEVLEKFSLATKPTFVINGLKLGVPYLLTVTAANSRGSSPPVTLAYTAPEASADKVISSQDEETEVSFTPLILVLVGVFLGVATCVGVGVIVAKKGRWRRGTQLKMDYNSSLKELQDAQDLPTIVCLNKEDVIRNSNGSPLSLYANPGKLLNNLHQSTMSLDNDIYMMSDQISVADCKAPLARTDSIEGGSSPTSSIRIPSAASSYKMPYSVSRPPSRAPSRAPSRPTSRPSSFKSRTSIPLNPDYLLQEQQQQQQQQQQYFRRDNCMAQSSYLLNENYLPPLDHYMMRHHYLAKSDNLLKESYLKNEIADYYYQNGGVPPPHIQTMVTLRRQPKSHQHHHQPRIPQHLQMEWRSCGDMQLL
ncbi:LOW QUALITY PROTEIN: protein turtle homolog B-like [Palaemon carinicauda]|uniref:LOW QUALITY PROTEIN: protein turtle homolog B-like n=1 Tax=Palaemon carinicauda TaxID=392227 RepID=UPI0035B67C7B